MVQVLCFEGGNPLEFSTLMESSVPPDSSLSFDIPETESSLEKTMSWDSENVDNALESPRKSGKPFEENDGKSSNNLAELGDGNGNTQPYAEFDEETNLKAAADSEIPGEGNGYERSDVPQLPEDYVDETNKNEGDEKILQAADYNCTLEGVGKAFSENIPSEVTNEDCREQEDDLHLSENSKEKVGVEEVQTADDPEGTESVKMGIPIQDSEHEPSVAKTVQPDEVAGQKSVENTVSGSENEDEQDIAKTWLETKSLSIDTKSDNYEFESIEGGAKLINMTSAISMESSPEPESKTSPFHFGPGQAADDVKQNQESCHDFVLEPVSRPESDSSEPASTPKPGNLLTLRNNEDLDPGSFLEPSSVPESDSLLFLRNNEDLNPDSTEHASLTVPESDWSSIFRNGKDVMLESAEDAKFIYSNTNESFNQHFTCTIANSLNELRGEPFHAGEAGVTGADNENIPQSDVMDTEAVDEKNSEPEVEGQDVCLAQKQGKEPQEIAKTDYGLTEGKEYFIFSAEKSPKMGFEVDATDTQGRQDDPNKISDTTKYGEDSSHVVESGAKNDEEDAKIMETEHVNEVAGDKTCTDNRILVENEGSVLAESGNSDQQSESEVQIQAKENMEKVTQGSRDKNGEDYENSRGTFLQRIWGCCGVLDWMRSSRD